MATKPSKKIKTPSITDRLCALSAEARNQPLPKFNQDDLMLILETMRQLVSTTDDLCDISNGNMVIDHLCSGRLSKTDKLFALLACGVGQ